MSKVAWTLWLRELIVRRHIGIKGGFEHEGIYSHAARIWIVTAVSALHNRRNRSQFEELGQRLKGRLAISEDDAYPHYLMVGGLQLLLSCLSRANSLIHLEVPRKLLRSRE